MKILFNAIGCGLGPNGGSSTIVKSANSLTKLGHEVHIIDSGPNKHTWTKLLCSHLKVKSLDQIPKADVAITTGFNTWKKTLQFPAELKVAWLRGWETWKISERKIVDNLLSLPLVKMVNGIGLQEKLKQNGHDSYLIRPGHTLEDFYPVDYYKKDIILGGLFHTKHSTKRTYWCLDSCISLKNKYPNLKLYMFGVDHIYNSNIDIYLKQPTIKQKNSFYNSVDVWMAPSELEGLHIVPAECMLTSCPVVTTNTPLAGTKDYVIDGESGLISKNNIKSFRDNIEILIKDKDLRIELGKNARRKIIELGSREDNMKKMIEIFEGLLK